MNASTLPNYNNVSIDDLPKQFAILQAANRIAHLFGKINLLEQAVEPLINEFIELVQADCGSIQLLRPGSERTQRTLIRKAKSQEDGFDSHLENLITGWILKHRSSLLTDDIAVQIKLGTMAKRYVNIASLLVVSIMQQENVIGVVNLIYVRPAARFPGNRPKWPPLFRKKRPHSSNKPMFESSCLAITRNSGKKFRIVILYTAFSGEVWR